jgi:hypothetical protein
MNQEQFELLRKLHSKTHFINVDDLVDVRDRTLIYGYEPDRATFHLYLKDGLFHKVVYNYQGALLTKRVSHLIEPEFCVPMKRIYAECCDFNFCALLRQNGVYLPFTTPNWERPKSQYYGKILENERLVDPNA